MLLLVILNVNNCSINYQFIPRSDVKGIENYWDLNMLK